MSTKRKASAAGVGHTIVTPTVKPAAYRPPKAVIDESRSTVSAPRSLSKSVGLITDFDPVELSSDPESDEDDMDGEGNEGDGDGEGEGEGEDEDAAGKIKTCPHERVDRNGQEKTHDDDFAPASLPTPREPNTSDDRAQSESPTSPTFGDLMQAAAPTIDVAAVFAQQQQLTPAPEGTATAATAAVSVAEDANGRAVASTAIVPIATNSLSTVLTQALHTNDQALLESCLVVTDFTAVRNTIERLESKHAISLLTKLASRLHRRPGRAGVLMIWVQWTLVAHGGALAGNTAAIQELSSLQHVLEERAKGLNSLLVLKGKLDLLEGQMLLRKGRRRRGGPPVMSRDEDEEEDVIWVEGEDRKRKLPNGIPKPAKAKRAAKSEMDADFDVPGPNGVVPDGDASSAEEESDAGSESSDEEEAAEESSDDDIELDDIEEEEDEDDNDGNDDDDDSDVGAPPAKVQKVLTPWSKKS